MSENKITGDWLDLPLDELDKKMPAETPRMKTQKVFKSVKKFFNFLGIGLGDSRTITGYRGTIEHKHHVNSPSQNFKAKYHADIPQQQPKTHEQWLIEEMAHEAYYKMVDGKGDHDCGHEH